MDKEIDKEHSKNNTKHNFSNIKKFYDMNCSKCRASLSKVCIVHSKEKNNMIKEINLYKELNTNIKKNYVGIVTKSKPIFIDTNCSNNQNYSYPPYKNEVKLCSHVRTLEEKSYLDNSDYFLDDIDTMNSNNYNNTIYNINKINDVNKLDSKIENNFQDVSLQEFSFEDIFR